MAEIKLQRSVTFTVRQLKKLEVKAEKLDIRVVELLRRIIDDWIDADERRSTTPMGRLNDREPHKPAA